MVWLDLKNGRMSCKLFMLGEGSDIIHDLADRIIETMCPNPKAKNSSVIVRGRSRDWLYRSGTTNSLEKEVSVTSLTKVIENMGFDL